MPIDHKKKIIFVHIPRTGGTSIEEALGLRDNELMDFEDSQGNRYGNLEVVRLDKAERIEKGMRCLQHLTALEIRERYPMEFKEYFKFAFVRNPWERLVSHYSYIMERRKDLQRLWDLSPDCTFDEYIEKRNKITGGDFSRQYRYLTDQEGKIIVDFIGKFEGIDKDFCTICERLGIKAELGRSNLSSHSYYKKYYTDESRAIVEELSRKGIELFGYQFA